MNSFLRIFLPLVATMTALMALTALQAAGERMERDARRPVRLFGRACKMTARLAIGALFLTALVAIGYLFTRSPGISFEPTACAKWCD